MQIFLYLVHITICIVCAFTWKSRDRFLKKKNHLVKGVWPQAQKVNGVAYDNSYCHNAAPIIFHLLDSYRNVHTIHFNFFCLFI